MLLIDGRLKIFLDVKLGLFGELVPHYSLADNFVGNDLTRHPFNQSNARPKPITTQALIFSWAFS